MKLSRLFREHPDDWNQSKLAESVGVDQSTISRIAADERTAALGLALLIEGVTGGLVRAEDVPMTADVRASLRALRRSKTMQDAGAMT